MKIDVFKVAHSIMCYTFVFEIIILSSNLTNTEILYFLIAFQNSICYRLC